jgi:predicted metal-binding protein
MFENFHLRQQLDTIVNPHTTNILLRIRVAHGLPPWKNCLAAFFGSNKASYILGNLKFLRITESK